MEPTFWQERWKEGRIGFHEGRPNAHLVKHLGLFGAARRILVPLCGKTEDLMFLAAHGHQVVGVELVESAARAFFDEHELVPQVEASGPFTRFHHGSITILVGDFFATTAAAVGPIDALYDRAALIALPPPLREAYVKHLRQLLPPGAPGLLISLEYPQHLMEGPPFSVPRDEVMRHFSGLSLRALEEVAAEGPRFTEVGARERSWQIRFEPGATVV